MDGAEKALLSKFIFQFEYFLISLSLIILFVQLSIFVEND